MRKSKSQYEQYRYLNFATAALVDHYLWTVPTNYNALCRIDMNTFDIEEVACFEEGETEMELYTAGIIHMEGKLYIIPGRGKNIAVYDIERNSLKYMHARDEGTCQGRKFGAVLRYGKKIYLFPQCVEENSIFKINTDDQSVEYLSFEPKSISGEEGHADQFVFGVSDGNYGWIALGNRTGIAKFDFDTEKMEIIDMRTLNSPVRDVCKYQNLLLLLDWNGNVTEYDMTGHKEKRIWSNENEADGYIRIVSTGENIWLLPSTANQIIRIRMSDYRNFDMKLSEQCVTWYRWNQLRSKFMDYILTEKKVYLWPSCINAMVVIDLKKNEFAYQEIFIKKQKYEKLSKSYAKQFWKEKKQRLTEEEVPLTDFLESSIYLEKGDMDDTIKAGRTIYQLLK